MHGNKESRGSLLLKLYLVFAKIGLTTFGGGYAMLPILQDEIVEKRGWATEEELTDYYAIGQCTPGIIAVNTATFIGGKYLGIAGGIIATLGFVTPSIIIISIIAMFLKNFADLPVVIHAFNGIRACVCVLILDSVIKLGKKSIKDYRGVIIFLGILLVSLFTSLSPILLVIAAGVAGFVCMPRKKPEEAAAVSSGMDIDQDAVGEIDEVPDAAPAVAGNSMAVSADRNPETSEANDPMREKPMAESVENTSDVSRESDGEEDESSC